MILSHNFKQNRWKLCKRLNFYLNVIGRTRLKLNSPNPDGRTAGFVTLTTKSFESKIPGSTDSTPVHKSNLNGSHAVGAQENGRDLMDKMVYFYAHDNFNLRNGFLAIRFSNRYFLTWPFDLQIH